MVKFIKWNGRIVFEHEPTKEQFESLKYFRDVNGNLHKADGASYPFIRNTESDVYSLCKDEKRGIYYID